MLPVTVATAVLTARLPREAVACMQERSRDQDDDDQVYQSIDDEAMPGMVSVGA